MKKGYLIAYLGAATTMGIVLSKAAKMTKKSGFFLRTGHFKSKTLPVI